MLELITLLLFTAILLGCVVFGIPILIALGAGFVIFISYALYKRFTLKQITAMVWSGISQAKTILIIFLLIGMLTALWRCGGTIAYIIYNSIQLINPNYFIVFTFLLCCLVSYLTGTSFGSVSTMGVICMTMGRTLGISTFMMGGAILSGVYYGDRFSPMSSSALLVASITGTDIYRNLKIMLRTSIVPFIITVAAISLLPFTARYSWRSQPI